MRIRQAAEEDVPAIMRIVRGVVPLMRAQGNLQWDHAYPNPQIFTEDIRLGRLWLAEADGGIAGVAAFATEQEPEYAHADWDHTQPALVVHRLAVDPEMRGMGVASALMRHAETVAQSLGVLFVRVDTNSENQATRRLFPKLGYRAAGEIALRFRPRQSFLCYEKEVPVLQGQS